MKIKLTRILSKRGTRFYSISFFALAVALAITGVVAKESATASSSATPTLTPSYKCSWNPDKATKTKVVAAFETALRRSSNQGDWRKRLVASPQSAKAAIEEILKKEMQEQITIPDDVAIAFFEYEIGGASLTRTPSNPQSHCMHVFVLPDFTEKETTEQNLYGTHLLCCYDPWPPP